MKITPTTFAIAGAIALAVWWLITQRDHKWAETIPGFASVFAQAKPSDKQGK